MNWQSEEFLDQIPGGLFQCTNDERLWLRKANIRFYEFLGYTQAEFELFFENSLAKVIYPDDLQLVIENTKRQLLRGSECYNEFRIVAKSGVLKWIGVKGDLYTDMDGEAYFLCICFDLTRQKGIQRELELSKQRYDMVLSQTKDIVYEWDYITKNIHYAQSFEKKFGYATATKNFPQCIIRERIIHSQDVETFLNHYKAIVDGEKQSVSEIRIQQPNGVYLWCRFYSMGVFNKNGKLKKVFGMISDIDQQKREMLRIQEKATRDPLTKLYNRVEVKRLISESLKENNKAALLIIDVDNFKGINDTLGHVYGDAVLSDITYKLDKWFGTDGIVGRYGGDEFIVFLPNIEEMAILVKSLDKILTIFNRSFESNGICYKISGSIGAAIYPDVGRNYFSLFKKADIALYHAKTNGKNRYAIYSDTMEHNYADQAASRRMRHIDSVKNDQRSFRDHITEYILKIFYENPEIKKAVPILFDLVGSALNLSRVYLYEKLPGHTELESTFEWRDAGVEPAQVAVFPETLLDNPAFMDGNDYFLCVNEEDDLDDEMMGWIQKRGVKSSVICRIYDEGRVVAVLGFEENKDSRKPNEEESDIVFIMSQTMTLFLLRMRKQAILEACTSADMKALQQLADEIPGGIFEIAVEEDFPVLYANDGFYNHYGCNPIEFKEKYHNKLRYCIHPDDWEIVYRKVMEAWNQGLATVDYTRRSCIDAAKDTWVLVRGTFSERDGKPVLRALFMDITDYKRIERKLISNEECYRIALKEAGLNVWEYDIKNKTLVQTDSSKEIYGNTSVIRNVPDVLLQNGHIHHNSQEAFRKLYKALFDGEAQVKADICLRNDKSNTYQWLRIYYNTIFDSDGNPIKAIALGENITRQKEAEIEYQQELQMRYLLAEDVRAVLRVNLTKDIIEFLKADINTGEQQYSSYSQLFEQIAKGIVNTNDHERFCQIFSGQALFDAYQDGRCSVGMEYRYKDASGHIIWMAASGNLVKDAMNGDLYFYVLSRDINVGKRMELSLQQRAEKDSLTGFYNQNTAVKLMKQLIVNALANNYDIAMMIFDIDNLNEIIIEESYLTAEGILREFSELLQVKFSENQVSSRFYSNEFVILLGKVKDRAAVEKSVEAVLNAVSLPYTFVMPKMELKVFVGVAMGNKYNMNFQDLYGEAKRALEVAKFGGISQYAFYTDITNQKYGMGAIAPIISDVLEANDLDMKRVVMNCAFMFISSMRFADVIQTTLQQVGVFYRADRVFIVQSNKETKADQVVAEWQNDKEKSCLVDLKIENGILDQACFTYLDQLRREKTVFVADIESIREKSFKLYLKIKETGVRSFYLTALITGNNKIIGYIVVDNPSANCGDGSLLNALSYFFTSELSKHYLQKRQDFLTFHDSLTGALNRNSYLHFQEQLVEGSLISLGVISIDINGLKNINLRFGNQFGDNLLKKLADALKERFPYSEVYRFSGDEFLVVCQNIAYDEFRKNVMDHRSALLEICNGDISIGYAWADFDIQIDRLIQISYERRMLDKHEYRKNLEGGNQISGGAEAKQFLESLTKNHFQMYLQPKADLRTGDISGAEALVRCIHPEQGVIPPSKFVPILEKEGFIHHVDLFIFEEVCKTLTSWKQRSLQLFTISLNFSRSTIMHENILGKMLEIYNRYDVPHECIEIEITESIGDIEREVISQISSEIAAHGFRIALDDFGAEYSNIAVLSAMKLDVLKLDRSIINDLFSNPRTRVIVKNFLVTCKELGIASVAEGVETVEQLNVLKELECDFAQGYYFNKPIPLDEFERMYLLK